MVLEGAGSFNLTLSTRSRVNTFPQVNDVYVAVDRCKSHLSAIIEWKDGL